MPKRIFIFVGPKGAGKSYLAEQVSRKFGLHFLRVEDIWVRVRALNLPQSEYEVEGNNRVMESVRDLLTEHDQVIIESVGASNVFYRQVEVLKKSATMVLVRIRAPMAVCLKRVRERDPFIHLKMPEERVAEINRVASAFEMNWDLEYDNSVEDGGQAFSNLFQARFLGA